MDHSIIKKGGWPRQPLASFNVTVANGEKLLVQDLCVDMHVEIQGEVIIADFFVLYLHGCDMVLGVQWLQTVGPIFWDFMHLTMQFTLGQRMVIWHGLQASHLILMSKKQASKLSLCERMGHVPYFFLVARSLLFNLCRSLQGLLELYLAIYSSFYCNILIYLNFQKGSLPFVAMIIAFLC